jgi:hypothetical protein
MMHSTPTKVLLATTLQPLVVQLSGSLARGAKLIEQCLHHEPTCSSSTLSTRQLANKTPGWLTITDTIHALGLRFGGSELTLCATSSQTSAWAHTLCHQVQPSWDNGFPRDGRWLCPALRDTLSQRATCHREHVLCKVLTERDKYFKRLPSYRKARQSRLLCKVYLWGVRGTPHALGTAVCEPVPPNVSSVADNVS